jgi:hypothetical protein
MEKDKYLNVSRPQKVCVLCGESLVDFHKHPSILANEEVLKNEESFRKDFCPGCWEGISNKDSEYFSYWITKRIQPCSKKKLSRKERNNMLLRLFEAIYRNMNESNEYHLFFLAHLLMRYKIFIWKGTEIIPGNEEAGELEKSILIFTNKYTGEEIRIQDQDLDGEKVMESQKEIDEFLSINQPEELPEEENERY